ncbi:hypothetical protein K8R47_03445 [archaeon]|nr:hypothetical protein [archaeon]
MVRINLDKTVVIDGIEILRESVLSEFDFEQTCADQEINSLGYWVKPSNVLLPRNGREHESLIDFMYEISNPDPTDEYPNG